MSDEIEMTWKTFWVAVVALIGGASLGFAIGVESSKQAAVDQAGSVACHSINKTWALIDGQYMCVTVTP